MNSHFTVELLLYLCTLCLNHYLKHGPHSVEMVFIVHTKCSDVDLYPNYTNGCQDEDTTE